MYRGLQIGGTYYPATLQTYLPQVLHQGVDEEVEGMPALSLRFQFLI